MPPSVADSRSPSPAEAVRSRIHADIDDIWSACDDLEAEQSEHEAVVAERDELKAENDDLRQKIEELKRGKDGLQEEALEAANSWEGASKLIARLLKRQPVELPAVRRHKRVALPAYKDRHSLKYVLPLRSILLSQLCLS